MFAKQTIVSASLVALLAGSVTAHADADPEEPAAGEVHPDGPEGSDAEPVTVEVAPEVRAPGTIAPTAAPPATVPEPAPEPRKTGRFELGAGFSTDDAFIASATIAQDNLFGTGNALSMHAEISKRRQLFLTRFVDPSLFGSGYTLGVDLYNDRRALPGFTREASGGSLTLSREVAPHLRAFATYRLEQVEPTGGLDRTARVVGETLPLTDSLISSLRGGLEYNTLDDPLFPTRGTRIGGSIEIADQRLGSDVNLMRTEAWASHHAPIGPFTLHVGGTLSTVTGEVPRTERLFLDGSSEVRGFAPGSFGPVDGFGAPVGGTMKVTGRAELEVPLVRRLGISAVGFLDAGGVYDRGAGSGGVSYGVGLLWRSPIGPIRFDLAWRPDGGGSPAFVFGLGGLF